jgi:hypothetical protein
METRIPTSTVISHTESSRTTKKGLKVVLGGVVTGLALSLGLTGCGSAEPIKSGTVINKIDTPARDWTYLMPVPHTICSGGKVKTCTTWYSYVPIQKHDPEKWSLVIENCSQKPPDTDKCPSREIEISQEQYGRIVLGQEYVIPPEQ